MPIGINPASTRKLKATRIALGVQSKVVCAYINSHSDPPKNLKPDTLRYYEEDPTAGTHAAGRQTILLYCECLQEINDRRKFKIDCSPATLCPDLYGPAALKKLQERTCPKKSE